jgi:hypothetical protein
MRVTDIIRGILDLAAQEAEHEQESQVAAIDVAISPEPEVEPGVDPLAIMRQLAGMSDKSDGDCGAAEPEYANEPNEQVSAMTAAFPAGDDIHHSKNPADIRTNAPSMYPGFQVGGR